KEDFPSRLTNFLNCLQNIRDDKVCHHGNRNELVFTLNKIYEGVDLIEDARSTIYETLKDRLNEKFWQEYPKAKDKDLLLKGLFKWINDNDPQDLLSVLNIKKSIVDELHAKFIKNGSDPKA